jgi:GAF domain-containing protein
VAKKPGRKADDYVQKIRENTQKYLRGLLDENEKLCRLLQTMEAELDRHRAHGGHLQTELSTVRAECESFRRNFATVEAQNNDLASLYVASFRLHGSTRRDDVLVAIEEIVASLIGSEELVIYELQSEGVLSPIRCVGIAKETVGAIALGEGVIGSAAQSGRIYIAPEIRRERHDLETSSPSVCIPLRVDGRVVGAIAIHRLLEHKPKLEDRDHELFALLGTQAATALVRA